MKLDIKQLELEINTMSPRSKLYQVLKDSLTKRGYWRNHARGKAFPAGNAMGNRRLRPSNSNFE
jgi:hypothetical protein